MDHSGFCKGIADGEFKINKFDVQGDDASGYTVAVPTGASYLVLPLADLPLGHKCAGNSYGNRLTKILL
jgi:hypothetical protein